MEDKPPATSLFHATSVLLRLRGSDCCPVHTSDGVLPLWQQLCPTAYYAYIDYHKMRPLIHVVHQLNERKTRMMEVLVLLIVVAEMISNNLAKLSDVQAEELRSSGER